MFIITRITKLHNYRKLQKLQRLTTNYTRIHNITILLITKTKLQKITKSQNDNKTITNYKNNTN